MNWVGVNVLITGAGGFIGSHLTESLVELGVSVRAMVHYNARNNWGLLEFLPQPIQQELEFFLGAVQDPFSVQKAVASREIIFHL